MARACSAQTRLSMNVDVVAPAMTVMAAPVRAPDGSTIGVTTIAGPLVRLTEERTLALGPTLKATAQEVSAASDASVVMKKRAA